MNQEEINSNRKSREFDQTERLIEYYKYKERRYDPSDPPPFPAYPESFEAIRRILVARGVSDPSIDLSPPKGALDGELPYERPGPNAGLTPGYGITGGFLGGVVGYLLGSSPLLSFGDVITRGASLKGIDILMRPAAESAFNSMLAGVILGAVAGVVIAALTSNQRATGVDAAQVQPQPSPGATFGPCPHCGTQVPGKMQFCGKCGKSLSPITCLQCGQAVPPDQQFCGACGTRVG